VRADPKSAKRPSSCQCLFALLGSSCKKALHKQLDEIDLRTQESISSTFHMCIFCTKVCSKPNSKQRKAAQFAFVQKMHA